METYKVIGYRCNKCGQEWTSVNMYTCFKCGSPEIVPVMSKNIEC